MKVVFIDTEFTGIHMGTTVVSLGMVTLEGKSLYLTLNDYDREQVTDWLKNNVINLIDESKSVTRKEAFVRIKEFLDNYSQGKRVSLISAGKLIDIVLLYEFWHNEHPGRKYFSMDCLPDYLNHASHFDLSTFFYMAGVDPNLEREKFLGKVKLSGRRHNSLYDVKIVRECFLKLIEKGEIPRPENITTNNIV
ncbi:MAG: 3'-5' exoribonuclease [Candidatus Omnitrophica bacterium]|nr:3'-5' exoribonuclease [Candidatus Omnitrophota bacterium]